MEKIKAVNLGGWFVLEKWMKPEMFEEYNIPKRCETSFVCNHPFAKKALEKHWESWITIEDIFWLKNAGINLVRIPVPWWLFPEDFVFPYPYHTPIKYLDKAMDFIHEAGMKVMIDLHTAPGSQNGFDNGGIDGERTWQDDLNNIEVTTQVLEKIALRYKDHPALHSIQFLNEPHRAIDIDLIKNFYLDSYKRLRKILSPNIGLVFHDAFRFSEWNDFFLDNHFENVYFDTHIYQCFDEYFDRIDTTTFLNHPFFVQTKLEKMEKIVPVIIGEWSLGARRMEFDGPREMFETSYSTNQLKAYESVTGWVFWSYKISDFNSGWNFRALVERGIIQL
ncbi:MAG: cellulase family glycosylhydrolase [Firmicutes bacterium]|nr:cellulase family glycosylhydrolase [Bacillota bacterium]